MDTLFAFYVGGVIALVPIAATVRFGGKVSLVVTLIHSLGWPLLFLAWAVGLAGVRAEASIDEDR